jgi:hypothetical protein
VAKKKGVQSKVWLVILGVVLAVVGTVTFLVTRPEPENRNYRDPQSYIGLSETEAVERAQTGGLVHRVLSRDGVGPQAVTVSRDSNRVNFVIVDGKVTSALFY